MIISKTWYFLYTSSKPIIITYYRFNNKNNIVTVCYKDVNQKFDNNQNMNILYKGKKTIKMIKLAVNNNKNKVEFLKELFSMTNLQFCDIIITMF